MGQPVPVDRVIANVRAQIKDHPNDAASWLVLGRVLSYSYGTTTSTIPMQGDSPHVSVIPSQPRPHPPSTDEKARLKESIEAFRKSISIDGTNALAHLGLGWDLEQLPDKDGALDAYRKAYELASKTELAMKYLPPGFEAISLEAAQRIIELRKPAHDAEITRLEKSSQTLRRLPRAMTPVIFSFREGARLDELVAPDVRVGFDLDGFGGSRWSWLQSSTGILVWDPRHTGVVDSGLQLFGTATWWMFWHDGYAALAALDDDRDGWLAGAELNGIAIWIDRNQNGRSEPGEVISLAAAGIVRLRVSGVPGPTGVLGNACGVEFADGRCTPSYDWIASGVAR
jgi:tetratricopeptide (TPR) repeat protein